MIQNIKILKLFKTNINLRKKYKKTSNKQNLKECLDLKLVTYFGSKIIRHGWQNMVTQPCISQYSYLNRTLLINWRKTPSWKMFMFLQRMQVLFTWSGNISSKNIGEWCHRGSRHTYCQLSLIVFARECITDIWILLTNIQYRPQWTALSVKSYFLWRTKLSFRKLPFTVSYHFSKAVNLWPAKGLLTFNAHS